MAKYAAFGTTLKIGGTAGTAVANVTEIDGPELGAEEIDMTAHDSGSAFREILPSFLDAGEVSLKIQYDPAGATHKALLTNLTTRASASYALTFPTTPAASWVFTGYVMGFKPSAPMDGALTADVTIRVYGAPTLPS
jgi:hypothetical protein